MNKLASMALVAMALGVMGCQQQASRPAEAPQGGPPPGAMPPPPGPGPMAHHPGPGPMDPWAQPGQHRGWQPPGPGPGAHPPSGDRNNVARGRMHKGGRQGKMGPRPPRGAGPMGHGRDPGMMHLAGLGVHFYPPQMLLHRAHELGLSTDQIAKIRQEVLGAQTKAVDLRAKAQKARIEVARLLTADKVDEKAVNAQLDEVAKAQGELQKLHLGTMLHVRGLLTAEQRQKLDERKPWQKQGKPMGPGPTSAIDEEDDEECEDCEHEDDEDEEAEG